MVKRDTVGAVDGTDTDGGMVRVLAIGGTDRGRGRVRARAIVWTSVATGATIPIPPMKLLAITHTIILASSRGSSAAAAVGEQGARATGRITIT